MEDFFNRSSTFKKKASVTPKPSIVAKPLETILISVPRTKKRRIESSSSSLSSDSEPDNHAIIEIKKRRSISLTPPPIELNGVYLEQFETMREDLMPQPSEVQVEDESSSSGVELIESQSIELKERKRPTVIEIKFTFSPLLTAPPPAKGKAKQRQPQKPIKIKASTTQEFSMLRLVIAKRLKTEETEIVFVYKGVKLAMFCTGESVGVAKGDSIVVWGAREWEERKKGISIVEVLKMANEKCEDESVDEVEIEKKETFDIKIRDHSSSEPLKLRFQEATIQSIIDVLIRRRGLPEASTLVVLSFEGERLDPAKTLAHYIHEMDMEREDMIEAKISNIS